LPFTLILSLNFFLFEGKNAEGHALRFKSQLNDGTLPLPLSGNDGLVGE
jgi:hypothetical protein